MQKNGIIEGIISLIFSIIGLFSLLILLLMHDIFDIYFPIRFILVIAIGFSLFGIIGLCLGIIIYVKDKKNVLGLVAFILGLLSIPFNIGLGIFAGLMAAN